jgi:hypothetical protein
MKGGPHGCDLGIELAIWCGDAVLTGGSVYMFKKGQQW